MKLFNGRSLSATFAVCLGAAMASAAQLPVNLGSNSGFAILAGTTVTVTGGGTITGNIGIYPGTAFVSGVPAVTVNGTVYAGGPVAAQAQADLTTAFNDAAGRATPIAVAGNIGGQTLTPGLYKSTSSLAVSSGDLTLDAQGNSNAVFIFQIGSTLTMTSGRQVILAGGANPANIFWQVGSSATIGTTAVLHGNVLAGISISVLTGATLDGRALAQGGAVTVDTGGGSSISVPVAPTRPTVTSTVPSSNAIGVPIGNKLTATFSTAMDSTTITPSTFTLMQGALLIPATVTYSGTTATLTPASMLAPLTAFTATVTTGAKDLAGNALAANYVWNFTTGALPDIIPPTVISTVPSTGAIGVPIGNRLSATFSEAIDPTTISGTTFTLLQAAVPVPGTVTYSGITAVFAPTTALTALTTYTATITTGVKDLAGNALVAPYTWSFTTGALPDTTPPTVLSTLPANNAVAVPIASTVSAVFSKPIDPSTVTTSTVTLQQGGIPVAGTVTYSGTTATFTPLAALALNTGYTATVTTGIKDLAGNALAASYLWSFTTAAALPPPINTPPTVTSNTPVNGSVGVATGTSVTVTFSKAMNPFTITTATVTLQQGVAVIAGAVTYAGTTATFTPAGPLAFATLYNATVTTGVKDLAGNALASPYTWSFTTAAFVAPPDTTPPVVTSNSPLNNAVGVTLGSNLSATFSKPIDPTTLTSLTMLLKQGSTAVVGAVTYNGSTASFTPNAALLPNAAYTATIGTGVKDLSGNALASPFTWTFTTGAAVPQIYASGTSSATVNLASYVIPVVAGSDAAIFGTNLSIGQASANMAAASIPTALAQSSFLVGGVAAPMFFASPGQVNVQIPWEVAGQAQVSITATVNGIPSNTQVVTLAPYSPGIFTTNLTGSGQGAILIAPTAQLAAPGTPVLRGGYVAIFCTGLGPVSNQPATGTPALAVPLSYSNTVPAVTIGGVAATVTFSGLGPTLTGVYQINAIVPGSVTPGNTVPVIVSMGATTSNVVTIAVQ